MSMKLKAGVALALLVLAATLAACGGSDDSDPLTVYSGRDEELVAPVYEDFTEETGIEVEVRYADTAELAATIIEEGENSPADVYFGQDAGAVGALQKEQLLATLPEAILDRVAPRFRSPQGEWVGISGRARVIAYNTENVRQATLPDSVFALTEPEWRGKAGWAPENASFQAFVTALRLIEGEQRAEQWLSDMVANDAQVYSSNSDVRDAVAAGEIDLGLINHYYVAQARAEAEGEYPVEVHYVDGDDAGALINVAAAAVLSSSDATADAEQLIEYMLSDSAQEYFADETKEYPLVAGVEADPTLVPLTEIDSPEIDLSDIDDLEATLEMIQRSGAL